MLSVGSPVLRSPPTPSQAACHFPGSPVIDRTATRCPQQTGPKRVSPVPRTTIRPFHAPYAGGSLNDRPRTRIVFHGLHQSAKGSAPSLRHQQVARHNDAAGFASCCGPASRSTPLRTRPHGHARGFLYQGPWCLPGPDSHRQAVLSFSLSYVMTTSLLSQRPSRWAHRRSADPGCSPIHGRFRPGSERYVRPCSTN
jgi:hypothetical protein